MITMVGVFATLIIAGTSYSAFSKMEYRKTNIGCDGIEQLIKNKSYSLIHDAYATSLSQNDSWRLSDMGSIQVALELYDYSRGHYPDDLQLLIDANLLRDLDDPCGTYPFNHFYTTLDNGGYHLGTYLENTESPTLSSDADFDSRELSNKGFNGKDPMYDMLVGGQIVR